MAVRRTLKTCFADIRKAAAQGSAEATFVFDTALAVKKPEIGTIPARAHHTRDILNALGLNASLKNQNGSVLLTVQLSQSLPNLDNWDPNATKNPNS